MQAAYYEENGTARAVLRVGEVDTSSPGPGEVRVKLATSGVNPSDVKSRAGLTRKIAWARVIPHSDGAGVIDQVGDGVPQARLGERVWVWNGQWKRPFGTAAEFVVLPSVQAVALPERVSFEEGACLGIPAMTAFHAVALAGEANGGMEGATAFVSGGAGSVSQYVIQFAKAQGAKVITTVSSEEKAKIAREAGADHTIDYNRQDVGARVMEITGKRGADTIVEMDLAANARLIPGVLRPKGSVIAYGTGGDVTLPSLFCLTQSIGIRFFLVYELDADERERAVTAINRAIAGGDLINRVAKPTYSLAEIAAAHEAVERGTIGNVIITI